MNDNLLRSLESRFENLHNLRSKALSNDKDLLDFVK